MFLAAFWETLTICMFFFLRPALKSYHPYLKFWPFYLITVKHWKVQRVSCLIRLSTWLAFLVPHRASLLRAADAFRVVRSERVCACLVRVGFVTEMHCPRRPGKYFPQPFREFSGWNCRFPYYPTTQWFPDRGLPVQPKDITTLQPIKD